MGAEISSDPGTNDDAEKMFRSSFITKLGAALLLVPSGIFLGYAFVEHAVLLKILMTCLAAPCVILIYRILRAGIVVGRDGVEVRGLLRDRKVPWTEVERFGLVLQTAMNTTAYVAVVLTDGSSLRTSGLTAASKTSKYGLRTVAEMEAARQKWAS